MLPAVSDTRTEEATNRVKKQARCHISSSLQFVEFDKLVIFKEWNSKCGQTSDCDCFASKLKKKDKNSKTNGNNE